MTVPADAEPRGGVVQPFLAHLDDLRRMLLWSIAALAVGMAAAVPLTPWILKVLRAPLRGVVANPDQFLRTLEVTGAMSVALQIIFWGGLLLAAPFILWAVGWFVFPGLTRAERRTVLSGLVFAVGLFAIGVLMGYFYALPAGLRVMLWFNTWLGLPVEFLQVADYIGFTLKLLLAFGLTFELPVLLLLLGRIGIIRSAQLRQYRRHAIVIILIIAMVITPTTDPFSQLLLAVPLILLYEICIWLIWAKERERNARQQA